MGCSSILLASPLFALLFDSLIAALYDGDSLWLIASLNWLWYQLV